MSASSSSSELISLSLKWLKRSTRLSSLSLSFLLQMLLISMSLFSLLRTRSSMMMLWTMVMSLGRGLSLPLSASSKMSWKSLLLGPSLLEEFREEMGR